MQWIDVDLALLAESPDGVAAELASKGFDVVTTVEIPERPVKRLILERRGSEQSGVSAFL